jgi:hypothetical protein
MAIGELELLPAVRQAPTDWLIIADGFQLPRADRPGTDRHALHLAEVLQMALREAAETPEGFPMFDAAPQHYPEDAWVRPHRAAIEKSMKRTGLAVAGILQGSVLVLIQFDVCEEINLDSLRDIFGARRQEASFKHPAPGYVRYQRPPVVEPVEPLVLESGERLDARSSITTTAS